MAQVPAKQDLDRALIGEVAMDVGKGLVAYIEQMYPEVWNAMNSGAKLSFRNHIYNDLMSALNCRTEQDYREWLADRKAHRREITAMYRKIRKQTAE